MSVQKPLFTTNNAPQSSMRVTTLQKSLATEGLAKSTTASNRRLLRGSRRASFTRALELQSKRGLGGVGLDSSVGGGRQAASRRLRSLHNGEDCSGRQMASRRLTVDNGDMNYMTQASRRLSLDTSATLGSEFSDPDYSNHANNNSNNDGDNNGNENENGNQEGLIQAVDRAQAQEKENGKRPSSLALGRGLSKRFSNAGASVRNLFGKNNNDGKGQEDSEGMDAVDESGEERETVIRFFDVCIREYSITVSDNPCVKSGAAMELGWEYNLLERIPLDDYETKRCTERKTNFRKESRINRVLREKILREFGATDKQIMEATKAAQKIRDARRKSIAVALTDGGDKRVERMEERKERIRAMFGLNTKKGSSKNCAVMDFERLHPTLMILDQ